MDTSAKSNGRSSARTILILGLLLAAVGGMGFGLWNAWAEDDPAPAVSKPSAQPPAAAPQAATGQIVRDFAAAVARNVVTKYLLFLPETYGKDKAKKWPLILFLHGSGERGTNPASVRRVGLPKKLDAEPAFPFLVLSPQCPKDKWWTDAEVTVMVMALLDEVCRSYSVDPDRVYLTGLSMGGFGVWGLAGQYPDRFAAAAPLCGGGNLFQAPRLKSVPVWAFHGAKDKAVPVVFSQQMVSILKRAGGTVQLTIYPDLDHIIWDKTYADDRLYEWFLMHKRIPSPDEEKPAPPKQ
jgi:predicted peptidase